MVTNWFHTALYADIYAVRNCTIIHQHLYKPKPFAYFIEYLLSNVQCCLIFFFLPLIHIFVRSLVYCIPAGWIWRESGFLYKLGALDYAGCACVHLIGGISALVAAYMLRPRLKRYENGTDPLPMGNPTNAIVGTFALWWGWV